MGYIIICLLMVFKYTNLKQKHEINATPWDNVLKYFLSWYYEKDWIIQICQWFSVDYDSTDVADILDIHKKHGIKYLNLLKRCLLDY